MVHSQFIFGGHHQWGIKKEEESPSVLKGKEEESTMCDELNFRTVQFERKMKESRKRVERKMKRREKNT